VPSPHLSVFYVVRVLSKKFSQSLLPRATFCTIISKVEEMILPFNPFDFGNIHLEKENVHWKCFHFPLILYTAFPTYPFVALYPPTVFFNINVFMHTEKQLPWHLCHPFVFETSAACRSVPSVLCHSGRQCRTQMTSFLKEGTFPKVTRLLNYISVRSVNHSVFSPHRESLFYFLQRMSRMWILVDMVMNLRAS
jgi:hypothetical protein